jgi:hypothetical protein
MLVIPEIRLGYFTRDEEKNELAFSGLSDVGNKVARNFGILLELSDDLESTRETM